MAVKKVVKKRKELKNVDKGQVHIQSSFNKKNGSQPFSSWMTHRIH